MSGINLRAQDAYLASNPQSKKPVGVNGLYKNKPREQALSITLNLGLLLGTKSDVDDDDFKCQETRALTKFILTKPFKNLIEEHLTADTIFNAHLLWTEPKIFW